MILIKILSSSRRRLSRLFHVILLSHKTHFVYKIFNENVFNLKVS